MYLDWETVGDPQISPDGSQIIYARRWVDKINDTRESSLWIMNVDGSRNRFLTNGGSPRWSPDGTRILFTRQGQPRGNQLWVRWMDAEGAETQITRLDDSPGAPAWSPDGKNIAFAMDVEEREPWTIRLPARPEGARWTPDPKVVTRPPPTGARRGSSPAATGITTAWSGHRTGSRFCSAGSAWTARSTSGASRRSTPWMSRPARSAR
jgi:Tol biopolymer transport system component